MANRLEGITVAILVEEGFEQIEYTQPNDLLQRVGARTDLIAPRNGRLRAWKHTVWGDEFDVYKSLFDVNVDNYDALYLPGGVLNADKLRMNSDAVAFVRMFFDRQMPVGAICHAPWMLVEADVVRGRTLTSYPSLATDIRNAGGIWVDREAVTDMGLVTARKPDDIPAFAEKMIEEFAEGRHVYRAGGARHRS